MLELDNKGWMGILHRKPLDLFVFEIRPSPKYPNHYFCAGIFNQETNCFYTRQPEKEQEVVATIEMFLKKYDLDSNQIKWQECNEFTLLEEINFDAPPLHPNPSLN